MKNSWKYVCLLVVSLGYNLAFCQLSDLARADYSIVPGSSSKFESIQKRILFNYPIKIKESRESYLFLGLDYSNVDLVFSEEETVFEKGIIDGFQIFDFNIGYTFAINTDWRFGARLTPGFSSNLSANSIGFEDAVISADVVFIKDKKQDSTLSKPYRLILGLSYSQNRGFPYPLPFISYYRKLNPFWSYKLGIPDMNLQYHFDQRHRLKLYARLDGFTANIQNGIPLNGGVAESINMSLVLSGLQYEYHFLNRFELYTRLGYIVNKNVQLRDSDENNILLIDDSRGVSLQTGIRLKI